jgi:hypothetical protein
MIKMTVPTYEDDQNTIASLGIDLANAEKEIERLAKELDEAHAKIQAYELNQQTAIACMADYEREADALRQDASFAWHALKSYSNGRCFVCGWPLKPSAEEGCVPGNCSFRSDAPEYESLRNRAKWLWEFMTGADPVAARAASDPGEGGMKQRDDPDTDGWHYSDKPVPEGDGRKLVTLMQDGLVWVGIRHWTQQTGCVNNNEPCGERIIAWMDLPRPAEGRYVGGQLL